MRISMTKETKASLLSVGRFIIFFSFVFVFYILISSTILSCQSHADYFYIRILLECFYICVQRLMI